MADKTCKILDVLEKWSGNAMATGRESPVDKASVAYVVQGLWCVAQAGFAIANEIKAHGKRVAPEKHHD